MSRAERATPPRWSRAGLMAKAGEAAMLTAGTAGLGGAQVTN